MKATVAYPTIQRLVFNMFCVLKALQMVSNLVTIGLPTATKNGRPTSEHCVPAKEAAAAVPRVPRARPEVRKTMDFHNEFAQHVSLMGTPKSIDFPCILIEI